MPNKDYQKEVGVASSRKTVPKAVGIVVMLAVLAVIIFGAIRIAEAASKHDAGKAPAAPAAAPATTTPAATPPPK